MIWKPCTLEALTGQTEDALGNLVGGEWKVLAETFARFTPWTDEQIVLEGRDVTKNEQRFAIPIPFDSFPKCTHAVISGHRQKINQKINLEPRYTVIQVKVYEE
uniref:Uncharacterized protein n=1 Tax=Siphoviridae sp. ctnNB1 TaxID=2825660 RepID=A0A8S5UVC3_9CAUD|nr:MAG TPA: hypothetical protein [Siphoviridae sp. ctnNB1]